MDVHPTFRVLRVLKRLNADGVDHVFWYWEMCPGQWQGRLEGCPTTIFANTLEDALVQGERIWQRLAARARWVSDTIKKEIAEGRIKTPSESLVRMRMLSKIAAQMVDERPEDC